MSKNPISPDHYKDYLVDKDTCLQWLDTMSRIKRYCDPEKFKAAVELQVRKYLDRNGGKDEELQELLKAKWYLTYLCEYIKNGNKPILITEVMDE